MATGEPHDHRRPSHRGEGGGQSHRACLPPRPFGALAYYGGWEADVVTSEAIDKEVLAALEELDPTDTEEQENS